MPSGGKWHFLLWCHSLGWGGVPRHGEDGMERWPGPMEAPPADPPAPVDIGLGCESSQLTTVVFVQHRIEDSLVMSSPMQFHACRQGERVMHRTSSECG